MKILTNPIVLALYLVALFVYASHWLPIELPDLILFYLNDLLCMPIVLSLCLAAVRFYKKSIHLYVPIPVAYGLTVFYIVYFEWILPQINERYTGDIIDVALYLIGTSVFMGYQKRLF